MSALDAEKTLLDMERRSESSDRERILERAEFAERTVSDLTLELQRLARDKHPYLQVPLASVSDVEPCDLSQKLKAAQQEVRRARRRAFHASTPVFSACVFSVLGQAQPASTQCEFHADRILPQPAEERADRAGPRHAAPAQGH